MFETLSEENIMTVFAALLVSLLCSCLFELEHDVCTFLILQLEFKILFVTSENLSAVLQIGEWMRLAAQPLQWCHIYAPVAPQHLALELLQCPAPYMLGILRSTLQRAAAVPPSDAVVVDLDANTVRVPKDLKVPVRALRGLASRLFPLLRPHYTACDSASLPNIGMYVLQTFIRES
jgi:hypothetical protein